MDANDVRIFCEMAFSDWMYNSFAPSRLPGSSTIGKKLGLDEKTVRLRIKKMEESGFIKYYQLVPNLPLIGMNFQGLFRFEAMNVATKFGALSFIHEVNGIVEALDYVGPTISLSIASNSEYEVQETAKKVAARFELTRASLGIRELKKSRKKPDTLDWRVISRLRYGARDPTKDIASALSTTPRIVEYRRQKLLEDGAFQIKPVLNTQKQEGLVFYELNVSVDPTMEASFRRTVAETYGKKMWSMRPAPNGTLLMEMFSFSLADPEQTLMELFGLDGVKWCTASLLKEVIEPKRPNWIDRLVQEKITE